MSLLFLLCIFLICAVVGVAISVSVVLLVGVAVLLLLLAVVGCILWKKRYYRKTEGIIPGTFFWYFTLSDLLLDANDADVKVDLNPSYSSVLRTHRNNNNTTSPNETIQTTDNPSYSSTVVVVGLVKDPSRENKNVIVYDTVF